MSEKWYLWEGTAPHTEDCGDQAQPSLTPFMAPKSRGAVVVCPGGGYTFKAEYEGAPIARMLQQCGISAFVLDYRVEPCRTDTPLVDAQRAIRLLRHRGYEKVGIMGFSAGGHMSCLAATLFDLGDPNAQDPVERLSCRPDVFVPCYPLVTLDPDIFDLDIPLMDRTDPQVVEKYSAHLHVRQDTPPAFIWHTVTDDLLSSMHPLLLAQSLAKAGVNYEMHLYPCGTHGMALARENSVVSRWKTDCVRFLKDLGFAG